MISEREIQRWLVAQYGQRSQRICVPNAQFFCNESDLLIVYNSNTVDEYEIKISRSDFKADQKKKRWDYYRHRTPWKNYETIQFDGYPEPGRPYNSIKYGERYPNRFWYVVPDGLITPDEVPDYAGLIYYPTEVKYPPKYIVKKAPVLHRNKLDDKDIRRICYTLSWRCWTSRDDLRDARKEVTRLENIIRENDERNRLEETATQ